MMKISDQLFWCYVKFSLQLYSKNMLLIYWIDIDTRNGLGDV
jgi:hypothetical protein